MTTHKSTAASVLTRLSNFAVLVTACALWLGLLSSLGRERFSWRAISSPAELDREGVSQTHLLQQARQRRPLCGVGTA